MARKILSDAELEYLAEHLSDISDIEDDASEEEDHISEDSDYQLESDDDFDIVDQTAAIPQSVQSKDGTINWMLNAFPRQGRAISANIIKVAPGPTRYCIARVQDIKSAFQLLLNSTLENIIIKMTNIEGRRVYGDDWEELDDITLQAYIGLLLLAGVYKSHGESTKSLWNADTGRPIFRATMSLKRFCSISRVLRFDDKSDRQERRLQDKLAPIRVFWEKWIEILPKLYNVGNNVTVDEQLVAFRGRCPFKQYIPSKPAKYGIKIWTLCDSASSYALTVQLYTGKTPGEAPEKNQGMRVVLDLTRELRGQNVTCDNFFTSYKLGQMLLKRNLTMLGTVRKNKPELPVVEVNKEVHSSNFYFTENTTLVSYIPKKNKNVILMSTFHKSKEISNRDDKKPQIILDYNSTKGAVDTLDQLIATYTCKRKTNRWPIIVFYNILDTSAYNAYVLWREINPEWNKNVLYRRRMFLESLGKELINPYILARKRLPRTEQSAAIVNAVQEPLRGNLVAPQPGTSTKNKRARCKFCPSKCDNKTNIICVKCAKYLCKVHVTYYCPNCKK